MAFAILTFEHSGLLLRPVKFNMHFKFALNSGCRMICPIMILCLLNFHHHSCAFHTCLTFLPGWVD